MAERDATHKSDKLDALFGCLRGDKEDEALDLIASMDVTTLSCLRFPYVEDKTAVEEYWWYVCVLKQNFPEQNIFTVLMVAVMRGHMRVVKVLLEKGVDMNAGHLLWNGKYTLINTPLLYAISSENVSLLDLLLENGADPLYDGKRYLNVSDIPFLSALGKGSDIFNRILQYSNVFTEFGFDTYNKHTCLCYAITTHLDKYVSPESFQFIQKTIQKGGIVCSEHSSNSMQSPGMNLRIYTRHICFKVEGCLVTFFNQVMEALRNSSLAGGMSYSMIVSVHASSVQYSVEFSCT